VAAADAAGSLSATSSGVTPPPHFLEGGERLPRGGPRGLWSAFSARWGKTDIGVCVAVSQDFQPAWVFIGNYEDATTTDAESV
jgi:hypothetical protein